MPSVHILTEISHAVWQRLNPFFNRGEEEFTTLKSEIITKTMIFTVYIYVCYDDIAARINMSRK